MPANAQNKTREDGKNLDLFYNKVGFLQTILLQDPLPVQTSDKLEGHVCVSGVIPNTYNGQLLCFFKRLALIIDIINLPWVFYSVWVWSEWWGMLGCGSEREGEPFVTGL